MKKMNNKPDLITLSHGGGVQTTTICEMIVMGEIEKPDAVIFSDTGDEPTYVYQQVRYIEERLRGVNVPFVTVSNGNMHDAVYSSGRFAAMPLFTITKDGRRGKRQKINDNTPTLFDISNYQEVEPDKISGFGVDAQIASRGKMKRQCTSEYKIVPIDRELRIMLLEMGKAKEDKRGSVRVNRGTMVETWIGFSMDEAERIKPPRSKWQRFAYPLIDQRMSRSDCVKWLESHGLPIPLSSSCRKCPLIGDARLIELRENDPKGWENRLQFDDDLRNGRIRLAASTKGDLYVHPSCVPLREVELNPKEYPLLGCVNHCMT